MRYLIFIILIIQTFTSIDAQSTNLLVSNSKEDPGEVINIKWLSSNIIYEEGVNLYRKEEGTPFWQKVNSAPITKGQYKIPAYAFDQDSSLAGYVEMAADMTPDQLVGLGKAFMLLKTVYSNQFALYLGIQFNDSTVKKGVTYRYMLKKIKGDKELFEGISNPIIPGNFEPIAPPLDVRVEGKNKKVNIWWKVENERFHSINIYRYSNFDTIQKKLNPLPIVLAERPGPDGKIGYPDVYFVDTKVNNDTNYFYSLAGIDFFGRESKYSGFVMASPRNRTPPPAPELIKPQVKLLDVDLFWVQKDSKKVVGYYVYRTPSIYKPFERISDELLSPLSVRIHDKVDIPGNYYYYIASVDKNGNEGKSNMVMAEFLDIYPPPAPKNLKAVADSGQITLTWNSVEDDHLEGYRLYRTVNADNKAYYALMNAVPIKDTTYVDKLPFNALNKFYYVVVSLDSSLNMSEHSLPASAILPDVVPPDVPFIKKISNLDGTLDIEWLTNRDADLMGYHLFREELVDSVPQITRVNKSIIPAGKNNYVDIAVNKNVKYNYFMKAIDSVGNLSAPSELYPAILFSEDKPKEIGLKNISVTPDKNSKQVNIEWQYSNSDDIKGVVIFRRSNEDRLRPVSGLIKERKYSDTLPKADSDYYYVLIAYSLSGEKWTSTEYLINNAK